MNWRVAVPWWMVFGRAALGPALAISARGAHSSLGLGVMIAAGFLSDIYDGILARRWGTDSDALRIADSFADTVFYLGALVALVECCWPALYARRWLIAALLALEVLRWAFDWAKFRRMASYHSYASKLWGILLAMACLSLLCLHRGFWLLTLALGWGIVCDLEGLAISLLLPEWTRDVKTLGRALALRSQMRLRT